MINVLSNQEIKRQMKTLPSNWVVSGKKLERKIDTNSYENAVSLLNKIADLADKKNHHPEICLNYNQLNISLWTDKVKGLTKKDFSLAKKISQLVD